MKKLLKDNGELIALLSLVWLIVISVILNVKKLDFIELILFVLVAFFASICTVFIPKMIVSSFKKIRKTINHNAVLAITMLLAFVTFGLWFFPSKEKDFGDLWLNLSAGFMSSIFTILVIDNILKKQKEKEDKPIQLALYRDVQMFTARFIALWKEMYDQCNIDRKEISVGELFTEETIDYIFMNLDLRGYPAVVPKQDWFVYIESNVKSYIELGNRILDRYFNFAEPELIYNLHYLINNSFFSASICRIRDIRSVDIMDGIPRPPVLMSYTVKPRERDYKTIKYIIEWCDKNYDKLNDGTIYKIYKKIITNNKDIESTSIMKKEDLQEFIIKFKNYGNKQEKE